MIKVGLTEEEQKLITAGLVRTIKHCNDQIKSDIKNGKNNYNRVNWRAKKIEDCQNLLIKFGGTYYTPKRVLTDIVNAPELGNPPFSV